MREARPNLIREAHIDDAKVAGEAIDDPPSRSCVVVAERSMSDASQGADEEGSRGLEGCAVSCENAEHDDGNVDET